MDIALIKGIGPKSEKILKSNGILTTDDLIRYYPYRYNIIKRSNIECLENNDKITIDGIVETSATTYYFNKKMNKTTFKINTGKYLLNVVIFNRAFLKSKIIPGIKLTLIGKYDKIHNTIVASDIRFYLLPNKPVIEPIYHSIGSISSSEIARFINNITDYEFIKYIPEHLKEKYKLIDKEEAIKSIHFPESELDLKKALAYFKYEELFLFMLKINFLKMNKSNKLGLKRDVSEDKVYKFIDSLPFELTKDQLNCVEIIYKELINSNRMNRLIQGDVGSGKTIVAIIGLYINFLSGYQGAIMAPTEVLAQQHYKTLKNIFSKYKINIEFLSGTTKKSERKNILSKLQNKEIDILVGTHALFSSDVTYNNLGLIITDEQHRFGVNQRSNLKNKGITPDIIYLSATPIPRTYALTIYGDMDVSNIKTKPSGRKEITTYLKKNYEIKSVLSLIYEEIKLGHQAYVIAPSIDESDNLENVNKLYEQFNKAFNKVCKIGILHGKMKNNEKDSVMQDFKEGKISVLISTTVIEVGIDVSNATVITIFDAYRFGLSQLHQLRGRVGRNDLQNYCVLISDKESDRLNIMTQTNDGFKISEEDFKLRGSGDIFGIRQSGDMSFTFADLKQDFNILIKAKEDSLEVLKNIEDYDELNKLINDSINLD